MFTELVFFFFVVVSDTYYCSANDKNKKHKFTKREKKKAHASYGVQSHLDTHMWSESDPEFLELQDHLSTYAKRKIDNIPLQIISPVTHLTWLWMCPNWRANFDFNFKRPQNWTDESHVRKFNHCWYMKYHNILDWHDFCLLKNGCLIYAGLVVDPQIQQDTSMLWYITKVEYVMSNKLKHVTKRSDFTNKDKNFFKPLCLVHYRRMRQRPVEWLVSENIRITAVNVNDDWSIVQQELYYGKTVRRDLSGRIVKYQLKPPALQHPDVAANKPYIFSILGFDKYHHTQFTGLNSMQTHGCYFWFGNFNQEFQFTRQATMYTCQAPALLKLEQILPRVFEHWEFIMKEGCLLWDDGQLRKVYGMVSHIIGDMQDKDVYSRKRGTNKYSRSDAMIWSGYEAGVKWPAGCNDLMEMDKLIPGYYMYILWNHLYRTCTERGIWLKTPVNIGKTVSLTTTDKDVYNRLPINSTLKAPLEINHTAMLGYLPAAFSIEWTNLHFKHNFDQLQTRRVMNAYLQKYWCNTNGVSCFLSNINTNIMVFNQIRHSWQKMVEIMISLPHTSNWCGNINILCALIRITGALMTCTTTKRRKELQQILIPILDASFVIFFQQNILLY